MLGTRERTESLLGWGGGCDEGRKEEQSPGPHVLPWSYSLGTGLDPGLPDVGSTSYGGPPFPGASSVVSHHRLPLE